MKRVLIALTVIVALMLAAHVAAYTIAINSDAYAVAAMYLRSDPSIGSQVGTITDVTLAPFDAEMRFTGESGSAAFLVTAETATGKRKIKVLLERHTDGWRVLSTRVLS